MWITKNNRECLQFVHLCIIKVFINASFQNYFVPTFMNVAILVKFSYLHTERLLAPSSKKCLVCWRQTNLKETCSRKKIAEA